MFAPKWLLRLQLCHLFVCEAAGAVLLLRVQVGTKKKKSLCVCVCGFFFLVHLWMYVNVKHSGGKSQRKNAHNGEMRATTWEDSRYACHYQTADREIVCVWPSSLVQSPLCSRLMHAVINWDQKHPAPEGAGKQANTTEAHSREPTPTLVWTKGLMNGSGFVSVALISSRVCCRVWTDFTYVHLIYTVRMVISS